MTDRPLKQEVAEWKQHKVTKHLVKELEDTLEGVKEEWANGGFTLESESGTLQLNSRALGNIKALGQLLDYIEGDMDSAESVISYEH